MSCMKGEYQNVHDTFEKILQLQVFGYQQKKKF